MQTFVCFLLMAFIPLFLRLLRIPRWSPAYVFSLFWCVQFVISYIIFPNTPWSPMSALYLLICCVSLLIGFILTYISNKQNVITTEYPNKDICNPDVESINTRSAKRIILLFIIIGIGYSVYSVRKYGFSLNSFFHVDTLSAMNNQIALARYTGTGINSGLIAQFFLTFVYAAPLAGGSFFPYAVSKKEKVLCFATFLPEMMILLSHNTKAGFAGCVIFWISGYFVSCIRKNGKINIKPKTLVVFGILIIVILLLFFGTMLLRKGSITPGTIIDVQKKFWNYFFGHNAAMDDWINNNLFNSDFSLGDQTFIGITRYLGGSDRVQGVYTDVYIGPDLRTNIFSYFRGVVQDYGFIGSVIFFLFFGCVMGFFYRKIRYGTGKRIVSEIILALAYAFSLFCFVSLFSYTSFVFAFVIFGIYLFFTKSATNRIKCSDKNYRKS